jgi:hypothetical protein
MSWKTPRPGWSSAKSLATHAAFGFGLFFTASVTACIGVVGA